jgi:hypothetical protein
VGRPDLKLFAKEKLKSYSDKACRPRSIFHGKADHIVVQLNGDGLDPAHVLVAVAASKFQV